MSASAMQGSHNYLQGYAIRFVGRIAVANYVRRCGLLLQTESE